MFFPAKKVIPLCALHRSAKTAAKQICLMQGRASLCSSVLSGSSPLLKALRVSEQESFRFKNFTECYNVIEKCEIFVICIKYPSWESDCYSSLPGSISKLYYIGTSGYKTRPLKLFGICCV